jgi:hypothetical protein
MAKSAVGYLTFLSDGILKYPSNYSKWLIWNRLLTKIFACLTFFIPSKPLQFTAKKSVDALYWTSSRCKRRQVTYYSYRRQTGDLTHMNMEFQRNCARIARLRSTLNQHFRPMLPVILFARSANCKYSKCKCLLDNNYAAPVTSQVGHGLSENHTCNITAGLCCSFRALSINNS